MLKESFSRLGKGFGKGTLYNPPPPLFNLVVYVLARMLQKDVRSDLIRGLGNDLVEGGVVSL
jgi:hypothetical protein